MVSLGSIDAVLLWLHECICPLPHPTPGSEHAPILVLCDAGVQGPSGNSEGFGQSLSFSWLFNPWLCAVQISWLARPAGGNTKHVDSLECCIFWPSRSAPQVPPSSPPTFGPYRNVTFPSHTPSETLSTPLPAPSSIYSCRSVLISPYNYGFAKERLSRQGSRSKWGGFSQTNQDRRGTRKREEVAR